MRSGIFSLASVDDSALESLLLQVGVEPNFDCFLFLLYVFIFISLLTLYLCYLLFFFIDLNIHYMMDTCYALCWVRAMLHERKNLYPSLRISTDSNLTRVVFDLLGVSPRSWLTSQSSQEMVSQSGSLTLGTFLGLPLMDNTHM